MKLQIKPHGWSCLAASFAMALDIPILLFHMTAGHDGSEIIFHDLPEPQRRRGFHVSEAVYVAMRLGYSATPIELFPQIAPSAGDYQPLQVLYGPTADPEFNWTIFEGLIANQQGVIEARTRLGNWHAVAFSQGDIYDPDGRVFAYSREACVNRGLYTTRLWRIEKF